jgi:hypothetical protein
MLASSSKSLGRKPRFSIDFARMLRGSCGDEPRASAWMFRGNSCGLGCIQSLHALRLLIEVLDRFFVARVPEVRQRDALHIKA